VALAALFWPPLWGAAAALLLLSLLVAAAQAAIGGLTFTWQGQPPQPPTPNLVTYRDPQSGKSFTVDEAHYNWPIATGIPYVPSWGGSQFEALMDPLAIPEAEWGRSDALPLVLSQ